MTYFETLPFQDDPEVFGMHTNANVTFSTNESLSLMSALLGLQPRSSGAGAGGMSSDETVYTANMLLYCMLCYVVSHCLSSTLRIHLSMNIPHTIQSCDPSLSLHYLSHLAPTPLLFNDSSISHPSAGDRPRHCVRRPVPRHSAARRGRSKHLRDPAQRPHDLPRNLSLTGNCQI